MMRITFVVPVLEVSGGARIIAGHAQMLAAKGHDVLIVAPSTRLTIKERAKALLGRSTATLYPKAESHVALSGVPFKTGSRTERVIGSDLPDADVLIATWWETAEWIWAMPASKGAKVHFVQHYEAHPGQPSERVDAVWRLPFFKIVIVKWLADLARESFGIENVALVPNSVDHALFKPRARRRGIPPTIGFLFHPADFKDMTTTLAALAHVKQSAPDVRFVSFGGTRPSAGQLPDDVEFHYLPKQEEIARIYGLCDVWLSTSRTEGYNLPPLEAMASGCPAVCSKTGRPLEVIQNGVNGYLVDQGDVEGFASALARIITLPDYKWVAMSQAAAAAVAHPTWEESSALFEAALLHSILPSL